MDVLINEKNSCEYLMTTDVRSGLRIKVIFDYIYVSVREDGDVSYNECIVHKIKDPNFHHLAIVANNKAEENRISNIDIDAIYVKNLDPRVYNDKAVLNTERL